MSAIAVASRVREMTLLTSRGRLDRSRIAGSDRIG
jgi:hypothetical protein